EPDVTVGFAEPKKLDEKMVATLDDTANFYHDLLMSNEDRFKRIWDYLARRGIEKDTIQKFNIGYGPPYSDDQHQGRALIAGFLPRFEKDYRAFKAFSDGGLVRFLNDETVKGYGYYCRQIDFTRKDLFSRNYGDYFAGRIVFPIYDADACPTGFVGRCPDDRGVRWLKQQTREIALTTMCWLYGIEKAGHYIRQYRTIILVEGIFDYFAFYNLLQGQDKPVVVSTLGSYLTPEAANILKGLDVEHFIVAYDWDEAARNGIERIAAKLGGWVYYLGGLTEGQDPYDMLKPVVNAISGFSLKHLKTDAQ
ncbi:toprim domain-containing protein, partial [Thermodesulfobacteriota bacterium]